MSGPFKLKESRPGEYVILEAFDDYYMGRPNIDQILIKIIPDTSVVNAAVIRATSTSAAIPLRCLTR